MPRKARDVQAQLTAKFRFAKAVNKATDHEWFELAVPGVPKILTKFSHGKKEIRDDILGLMAKQLRVTGPKLAQMLDCTMSAEQYALHVVEKAKEEGTYVAPA